MEEAEVGEEGQVVEELEEGVVVEELEEEMMKVGDHLRKVFLVFQVKTTQFMLKFQILAFHVMDR